MCVLCLYHSCCYARLTVVLISCVCVCVSYLAMIMNQSCRFRKDSLSMMMSTWSSSWWWYFQWNMPMFLYNYAALVGLVLILWLLFIDLSMTLTVGVVTPESPRICLTTSQHKRQEISSLLQMILWRVRCFLSWRVYSIVFSLCFCWKENVV